MRSWLRGKRGGLLAYLLIAALVVGALGWVTAAALQMEQEQQLQLAMWRLDSLVSPVLLKEKARPYYHFSAVYAPPLALRPGGPACEPGEVLEVSPLLSEELPAWMLVHFQASPEAGWSSPQVLTDDLLRRLRTLRPVLTDTNVTPARRRWNDELARHVSLPTLLAAATQQGVQSTREDVLLLPLNPAADADLASQQPAPQSKGAYEFQKRAQSQNRQQMTFNSANNEPQQAVPANFYKNGADWFARRGTPRSAEKVSITLGPMVPLWLSSDDDQERLALVRLVQIGPRSICQGVLLDWSQLQSVLTDEVRDLFPQARVLPVHEGEASAPGRTMTALPVQLDPGSTWTTAMAPGWTPLRIGVALAWAAAFVALLAVGLGGASLLNLSERRIRFVSAVTHELRTPLTTLRLYLDMLTAGLVKEEKQRDEYLQTLHAEAERLHRLIGNVLDFSRLENKRPRLEQAETALAHLLEQVRSTWARRCADADKELVVDNQAGECKVFTDAGLVQQILGNLIDNACKYSRGADDRHIWLRARPDTSRGLVMDVEDRGPGVPPRERRSIFRPFRRGHGADVTAGGVGLGLALADRWARLLGGRLTLRSGADGRGACFRLELPGAVRV
jgi:signal transduction histidine kinase